MPSKRETIEINGKKISLAKAREEVAKILPYPYANLNEEAAQELWKKGKRLFRLQAQFAVDVLIALANKKTR